MLKPGLPFLRSTAVGALAATLVLTAFSADADSRSRAAAKSTTIEDTGSETNAARSTTRRAAKERTIETDTTVARSKRTKRSRGPASEEAEVEAPFALASVASGDADIWAAAQTDQSTLDAHVRKGAFDGPIGALALFQLVGKASTDVPLQDAEQASLQLLLEASDTDRATTLSTLLAGAEAQLIDAAEISESDAASLLEAVALQLGFTRPGTGAPAEPKLGA